MVTGAVKLIVPLLTLMMSLLAGTPTGVQLVALNQSLETEPFHVRFVCADATLTQNRQTNPSSSGTPVVFQVGLSLGPAPSPCTPADIRPSRRSPTPPHFFTRPAVPAPNNTPVTCLFISLLPML